MEQGTDVSPDLGLAPAWLLVEINKKQCNQRSLIRPATLVGRAAGADVRLRHPKVSGVHCLIVNNGETLTVRDLESRAGTQLNDRPVRTATLAPNDVLTIGTFRCRLLAPRKIRPSATPTDRDDAGVILPPLEASAMPIGTQGQRRRRRLDRSATLIGSARAADIRLEHKRVSQAHAVIVNDGRALRLRDLRSRDGSAVNGRCVDVAYLQDGDVLRIGPFRLRIAIPKGPWFPSDDQDQPRQAVERDATLREIEDARKELALLTSQKRTLEAEWALEAEWLAASQNDQTPQLDAEPPRVS